MPTKLTSGVSISIRQQVIVFTFDHAVALAGCRLYPPPVEQLDPTSGQESSILCSISHRQSALISSIGKVPESPD